MTGEYSIFIVQQCLGLLLIGSVVMLMVMRRMVRELPIFFTYLCLVTFQTVFELIFVHHAVLYFIFFWIADAIDILLAFMVLEEIFRKLFQPYEALRGLGTIAFRWALVVVLSVAAVSASASPASHISDALLAGIVTMEQSVRVAQVGLVAFLFAFTSYFRIQWKDVLFGIVLGFGLNACGQIAMNAAFSHFGVSAGSLYNVAPGLVYDCAVIVWGIYLLRQKAPAAQASRLPKTELMRWNEALLELRHQ